MAFSPQRLSMDDSAAITVYVESDTSPVAAVSETRSVAAPTPSPHPEPEPEPETAAALDPPKEPALADVAPLPPEELALPDFSAPTPPPPKQEAKPEPKRAAPVVARPAPAPERPAAAAPAPPAASAPAATAAPSTPATVAPGWNALLAAWLAANRRYPDEARRRHEEGEVTVRFTVAADGRVSEAALVKGSGVASLDAAAVRLLQGATLPAPGIEAIRTVRIRFRLGD